jgi:ABC-type ATPase involved in cell division
VNENELWCVLVRLVEEQDSMPAGLVERAQRRVSIERALVEEEAA